MNSRMDSGPFWDADLVRISARRPYQIYGHSSWFLSAVWACGRVEFRAHGGDPTDA